MKMSKLKIRLHKNGKFAEVTSIAETAVLAAQLAEMVNPYTDFAGLGGFEEVEAEGQSCEYAFELYK